MHCIYRKLLLIYMLITASTMMNGYELFFNNFTNKTLVIACKKRAAIQEKWYQIVKPGGSVLQPWADVNCLESLQWAELDPKLPLRGGLDLINPKQGNQIPPDKQKTFDETFFSKKTGKGLYLWNNLVITVVSNELYAQTVEAAKELAGGFSQTACQAALILALGLKDKAFATLSKTFTALRRQLDSKLKTLSAAMTQGVTDPLYINTIKLEIKKIQNQLDPLIVQVEAYIKANVNQQLTQDTCYSYLGQVAEAAGNIQGLSLCKNREFTIFNTGQKDSLTGKPLLIAETTEGQ